MPHKHPSVIIMVALWCSASVLIGASAEEPAHSLELTKVDLFVLKQWTSREISVGGFALGMTREEVSHLAQQKGYKNLDELKQQNCNENRCDVYSQTTRPLGISIVYDENRKLKEIDIDSVDLYSGRNWARDVIALKLHGKTFQLFNYFSEDLCRALLGPETRKEQAGNSRVTGVSAIYEKRGVVIHYQIDHRHKVESFFDFRLTLVQPQI